jgi:hypothetical protein
MLTGEMPMWTTLRQAGRRLWLDQAGTLLSTEYVILGSILTIGLIVGITAAQNSMVTELEDYAAAVDGLYGGALSGSDTVTFIGEESGMYNTP